MVLALRQISTLRGERFDASRDHVTCMASTEALFFWVSHESTSLGPFGQHHVMKKEKMLDKYRNSEVFMDAVDPGSNLVQPGLYRRICSAYTALTSAGLTENIG